MAIRVTENIFVESSIQGRKVCLVLIKTKLFLITSVLVIVTNNNVLQA